MVYSSGGDTWGAHSRTSRDRRPGHYVHKRFGVPGTSAASSTPSSPRRTLDFSDSSSPRREGELYPPRGHARALGARPQTALGRPLGKFGDGYALYPASGGHHTLVRPFEPQNLTALAPRLRGNDVKDNYYNHLSSQIATGHKPPTFGSDPRFSPRSPRAVTATPRRKMLGDANNQHDEVGLWPHQQGPTQGRMADVRWLRAEGVVPPWGHPCRANQAAYYPAAAPQSVSLGMASNPFTMSSPLTVSTKRGFAR